jgi:hypothetical protein
VIRQIPEAIEVARRGRIGFPGTLLLITCLAVGIAEAGKKGQSEKPERQEPKLNLAATPAFGFAPLEVQMVATLTGVDPNDTNFCHAAVTWVRVDPGSSPEKQTRITEAPRCVHEADHPSVATTYSKSFELSLPGSYLYRVSVSGKDGRDISSNYVTVKVLRVP